MNLGLDLWPLWSPWGLALIGLCAGSFVNVWVRRLPLMMARRWWWDTSWQLQHSAFIHCPGRRLVDPEATWFCL